ncbi:hypothetical protein [Rhodococcoides yunnanense]|uniref:hypothetical protein n=1 Tax=Rhodococcoides yunnanense TaxID=278209 RepID=UPI000933D536|nr:hypothetical protein [Rhodococcus yunnanensis]
MTTWTGLTWDHPRGYQALRAALDSDDAPGCDLVWEIQSLEGFEAAPIGRTAEQYDLVVLDHPHIGEALAHGALRPLDDLYDAEELRRWSSDAVGPTAASYVMNGRTWALPLDAATQVSVRKDKGIELPDTWIDAVALSADVECTLPTSGPHLFLTLCGIALSEGADPGHAAAGGFLGAEDVDNAVEILRHFVPDGRGTTETHNPITVLEQMAQDGGPQYCPHIYGYVNYSKTVRPLLFGDAPAGRAGRRGSVLGGTGIAFSSRRTPSAELLDHVRWFMNSVTQQGFVFDNAGQPAHIDAWDSEPVDASSHGFFRNTRATMNDAWIRPRHDNAIAFQHDAADAVRACLFGHRDTERLTRDINAHFTASKSVSKMELSR